MKKVINFFNLKGPFGGPLGELLGYNEAIVESYEEYLKFIEKRCRCWFRRNWFHNSKITF